MVERDWSSDVCSSDLELDLNAYEWAWPSTRSVDSPWFIIADDFVGTGNTISKLMATPDAPLNRFIRKMPHAQLRFLIVAGFEDGIRKIRAAASVSFGNNAKVSVARLFNRHDRCFDSSSRILSTPSQQAALRDFCFELGTKKLKRLPTDMYLGFESFASLVVLADTVPNDSLPMLWCQGDSWYPLFPAAGLPG